MRNNDYEHRRSIRFVATALLVMASACGGESDDTIDEITVSVTTPSDPLFPDQWNLNNTGQVVPVDDDTSTAGTAGVDTRAELFRSTSSSGGFVRIRTVPAI